MSSNCDCGAFLTLITKFESDSSQFCGRCDPCSTIHLSSLYFQSEFCNTHAWSPTNMLKLDTSKSKRLLISRLPMDIDPKMAEIEFAWSAPQQQTDVRGHACRPTSHSMLPPPSHSAETDVTDPLTKLHMVCPSLTRSRV